MNELHLLNSKKIIDQLYSHEYITKLESGHEIDIPSTGSLGILATGYSGLIAWRKARKQL